VDVDVEVIDVPLEYNLLLGNNWNYDMTVLILSICCTLCFPHEGKTMTINQLFFVHASPNELFGLLIPLIDNSQPATEDIGVKMYSSLMGTFDFVAPFHHIYSMFSRSSSSTI
jgi:hypothetical protein